MKELIKQVGEGFKYFNLKISVDLLERVRKMAQKNHRSATGEILAAIEYYLENEEENE